MRDIALTYSGRILIRKVADTPVIVGISKLAGPKISMWETKIVNPLLVDIYLFFLSFFSYHLLDLIPLDCTLSYVSKKVQESVQVPDS